MANRKTTPPRIPEAVRDAVERTIQATVGSAQQTRGRAQDAVDELVRGAEAGAETVRARVKEAIDTNRPATYEEIRELQDAVGALARRLDAIEARLPAARGTKASTSSRKPATTGKAATARKATARKPAARKPAAKKQAARKPAASKKRPA